MPELLKLTYSNLDFQNFPGEDPGTPLQREGREGKGGEGGEREWKDREGSGGMGRNRGGREGRNGGRGGKGRGGTLDMASPPPPLETSSGSAPGVAC